MNIKEFTGSIPESMSGNIAHSDSCLTMTLPDGKALTLTKSGDDLLLDGKELTREILAGKIGKLREYVEMQEAEELTLKALDTRLKTLEAKA